MSPRWLGALVRARQAQEDLAQYELASAERRAQKAHQARRSANAKVDELAEASGCAAGDSAQLTGPAFAAAAAALQSAAAASAMATFVAQQADLGTSHRLDLLRRAAIDRDVAEHLEGNAVAAEHTAARHAAQRELDEIAARVHLDRKQAER